MSEHDRGAYTPQTDAPLTFDPRDARGGGGPTPMTLLVSAIVLMAMIVALLLFYRHGARHAGQTPELVGAPVGQTKSPPPAVAQSSDQAAGLQVYKDEAAPPNTAAPPSFEQAPEQPAPLPAPRPSEPPPAVLAPEPSPRVAAPAAPHPHAAPPPVARPPAPAKPVEAAKPPPPPPAVASSHPDVGASAKASAAGAAQPSHGVGGHPASATFKTGAGPVSSAPAPAKAVSAAKPKPATTEESIADAAAATGATGGVTVQIGAFSSAALAQKGWSDTAQLLPGQMAGRGRGVEQTTRDGKTFYRAYVRGFPSRADAASFCAALKAKAKPCFVK